MGVDGIHRGGKIVFDIESLDNLINISVPADKVPRQPKKSKPTFVSSIAVAAQVSCGRQLGRDLNE